MVVRNGDGRTYSPRSYSSTEESTERPARQHFRRGRSTLLLGFCCGVSDYMWDRPHSSFPLTETSRGDFPLENIRLAVSTGPQNSQGDRGD